MNKKISKFLKIIFIVFLINISQVIAATNTWEFDLSTDYTLSNSASFNFSSSIASLKKNILVHIWSSTSATTLNWAYDLVVEWNYAYVTNFADNSFSIYNVSNPASPTFVSEIVNNGWTIRLQWPTWLVKNGNYVYVASNTSDALQIINVSNPAAPTAAWQVVDATNLNWIRWLAISWNYLYTTNDVRDSLRIFNITTPTAPVLTGTLRDATNLNWARWIKIVWNYAYIAWYDWDRFTSVNISNPAAPVLGGSITDAANLNWAWDVEIVWNYAYVSAYLNASVRIINITTPTAPTAVWNISGWSYTLTNPRDLLAVWNNLYMTAYIWDTINVADISNPAAPTYVTKYTHNAANPLLNWAYGLFNVWDYLYITSLDWDSLEIMKISYDNASPSVLPNTWFTIWSDYLTSLSNVLWWGNAWSITYQISKDNWTTWYYWNWSAWVTTALWVTNSNSLSVINTNIDDFNLIAWTWIFKFKAFLTSNGDQAVELDSFTVNTTSAPSPGWVSTNMALWFKSNKWTSTTTDWAALNTWNDFSWFWAHATAWNAPIYKNNTTENLNYYPVVDFNGTSNYLENLNNNAYSDSYFMVLVPEVNVNWSLAWQNPFWWDCDSWVLSSGTCWLSFAWPTLWAFTVAINDEVITHAIGSSVNWRSAQIWAYSYSAWSPMLLTVNENATLNGTDIYEKWIKIDNTTTNTYQTLSTADFRIGSSIYTASPWYYNWKIAEIINYSAWISNTDRQKIESYLAVKYGITLSNWTVNYLDSVWNIVWNTSTSWLYKNNIFWIARDDLSSLTQIKSTSVNTPWLLSVDAVWEGTSMSPSFSDMSDLEYLFIADDNLSNTWTQIGSPVWYDILSRKWKVSETWDLWTLNLDFDVASTFFDIPTLSSWTSYYIVVDSDLDWLLSDETPISLTNVSWTIWRASGINLQNGAIFTLASESSSNNIPTNIWLSDNYVLENVVSWTTVWVLSTTDLDSWDSHTYTLSAWAWDTDNSHFSISWNNLNIIESPDYEIKTSYSIRIQTNDWNGWLYQKQFTIYVTNVWETTNTIIDFETPWKYSVTSWVWNRTTTSPFENAYSLEANNSWLANTQSCFEVNNTFYGWIWTIDFKYRVSSQAWADFFRFYIDNVEQQSWSWDLAWATYTKTDVTAWSHTYKWCYIKDWATNSFSDTSWVDYITFANTAPDLNPPVISSTNFADNSLLPGWLHNLVINYSDVWTWIDTGSATMKLYKWNWVDWWLNIAWSWINFWASSISTTQATYPTNDLAYGKYKYVFQIHDWFWNYDNVEVIFYIDKPEFTISTWAYLSSLWMAYWTDEIVVTVKTVWAPYQVQLLKDSTFDDGRWNVIIDWDWSYWIWYDISPYAWPRRDIPTYPVIWTWVLNVNTTWNFNTYYHSIKMTTVLWEEQVAWSYDMNISFKTIFGY